MSLKIRDTTLPTNGQPYIPYDAARNAAAVAAESDNNDTQFDG